VTGRTIAQTPPSAVSHSATKHRTSNDKPHLRNHLSLPSAPHNSRVVHCRRPIQAPPTLPSGFPPSAYHGISLVTTHHKSFPSHTPTTQVIERDKVEASPHTTYDSPCRTLLFAKPTPRNDCLSAQCIILLTPSPALWHKDHLRPFPITSAVNTPSSRLSPCPSWHSQPNIIFDCPHARCRSPPPRQRRG
jgi:hypothetical protein